MVDFWNSMWALMTPMVPVNGIAQRGLFYS